MRSLFEPVACFAMQCPMLVRACRGARAETRQCDASCLPASLPPRLPPDLPPVPTMTDACARDGGAVVRWWTCGRDERVG